VSEDHGQLIALLTLTSGHWRLDNTDDGAAIASQIAALEGIRIATLRRLGQRLGLLATPPFTAAALIAKAARRAVHGEGNPIAASRIINRRSHHWLVVASQKTPLHASLVVYRLTRGRWARLGAVARLPIGDLGAVRAASLTGSRDPDFVLYSGGADNSYLSVVSDLGGRWHAVPFDYGYGRSVMIDAQGVHGRRVETAANACGCASGPTTYGWARYRDGVFRPTKPPGVPPSCTRSQLTRAADPTGALGISLTRVACAGGWALAQGTGIGYAGRVVALFDQIDRKWTPISVDDGSGLGLAPGIYDLSSTLLHRLAAAIGPTVAPTADSTAVWDQFTPQDSAGDGLLAMSGVMTSSGSDWVLAEDQPHPRSVAIDLYRWSGSAWIRQAAFSRIPDDNTVLGLPGWYRAVSTDDATPRFVIKGAAAPWTVTIFHSAGAWQVS
jgi:hypothetical protein